MSYGDDWLESHFCVVSCSSLMYGVNEASGPSQGNGGRGISRKIMVLKHKFRPILQPLHVYTYNVVYVVIVMILYAMVTNVFAAHQTLKPILYSCIITSKLN